MGWIVGGIVVVIVAIVGIATGPDIKRYFRIRRM
jgi:hypothetical protein